MKRIICLLLSLLCLFAFVSCTELAPAKTSDDKTEKQTEKSTEAPKSEDKIGSITLEPGNEYIEVTSIDFSGCEYSDGYFSGDVSYVSHTTQKYVDEYDEYFFREIYFGFYNEAGELVGEEAAQDNYLYSRDYTSEDTLYVFVSSSSPITDVRVTKFVIEKPSN